MKRIFSRKVQVVLLDIFDMFSFLIFVGGIVLFIRFFIANPFTVIGTSMVPTFEEKDFIVVDKVTPRFKKWARGDIIVFVAPGKTDPYIKRIIGLPGETVKFKDGKVIICSADGDCQVLKEKYLRKGLTTDATCGKSEFKITDGLFVMGDNRGMTTDSLCCFGLSCYAGANYEVPLDRIIGKVYVRIFPHFSFF